MEQIKVIILPGGVTVKEVNRFQKLVYKDYYAEMAPIIGKKATIEMYQRNNGNYLKAESSLRTFEIENKRIKGTDTLVEDVTGLLTIQLTPGTTHTAKILSNGKIRIL